LDYLIILDFEATCDEPINPDPQEIVEFPSIVYNLKKNKIEDSFESFVKPIYNPILTDYCKNLTTITQNQVNTSKTFSEVYTNYLQWVSKYKSEKAVILTYGDWDLRKCLTKQLEVSGCERDSIFNRWINLKKITTKFLGKSSSFEDLTNSLNIQREGILHRGIDDCRNILTVVKYLDKNFEIDWEPTCFLGTNEYKKWIKSQKK